MQSVLTSREAWVRFACALFVETELTHRQIAKEADQMLIEYLKRFPDPKKLASAVLLESGPDGEPDGLVFTLKPPRLTEETEAPPSGDL